MLKSRTVSLTIERDCQTVYETIWRPEYFARWASGLTRSALVADSDGWWKGEGPEGPIRVRFTDHNPFGVMDHYVELHDGRLIAVPTRAIPNGDGTEMMMTMFRQPGSTEEQFAADLDWVERDLATLAESMKA